MLSRFMLPEASSVNITLGFTIELPFASGELAMSVNAALAVVRARPIPRTSASLVRFRFVGKVRFMIAPVCITNPMDQ